MTFQELILKYTWENIEGFLYTLYYDNDDRRHQWIPMNAIRAYREMYEFIRTHKPIKSNLETILISETLFDGENVFNVNGLVKNDNEQYSISMIKKCQWLPLEIKVETLDNRKIPEEEIIAHILWEMSWHGYDDESTMRERKRLENI